MNTKLSVNINKVALIRNARGEGFPDLVKFAVDCEKFGAEGITVHPRPDERHIRYSDIPLLKEVVTTELNIEGNPTDRFMDMVLQYKPHQCTLVPDAPDALTSNQGWDTVKYGEKLKRIIGRLQDAGIRVSIFVDDNPEMIIGAEAAGTDRIELYTGPYAAQFSSNPEAAVNSYMLTAEEAVKRGIGINAGHDLNLENLTFLIKKIPAIAEVSIGHALIADALYYGIKSTIQMYKSKLH
ncbi:pyridoxine 5'-phosphate synthase [Membranihabitans maritimus]|uniref:pyridoxine 5'-phosphate synthase n=1 Tax=Membranihabitans maritimus TaxID=2904244 RepID=UPI001F00E7A6|nr:pyridoxine 5'-phosphate synthase [Membranihabitans maritimus]